MTTHCNLFRCKNIHSWRFDRASTLDCCPNKLPYELNEIISTSTRAECHRLDFRSSGSVVWYRLLEWVVHVATVVAVLPREKTAWITQSLPKVSSWELFLRDMDGTWMSVWCEPVCRHAQQSNVGLSSWLAQPERRWSDEQLLSLSFSPWLMQSYCHATCEVTYDKASWWI